MKKLIIMIFVVSFTGIGLLHAQLPYAEDKTISIDNIEALDYNNQLVIRRYFLYTVTVPSGYDAYQCSWRIISGANHGRIHKVYDNTGGRSVVIRCGGKQIGNFTLQLTLSNEDGTTYKQISRSFKVLESFNSVWAGSSPKGTIGYEKLEDNKLRLLDKMIISGTGQNASTYWKWYVNGDVIPDNNESEYDRSTTVDYTPYVSSGLNLLTVKLEVGFYIDGELRMKTVETTIDLSAPEPEEPITDGNSYDGFLSCEDFNQTAQKIDMEFVVCMDLIDQSKPIELLVGEDLTMMNKSSAEFKWLNASSSGSVSFEAECVSTEETKCPSDYLTDITEMSPVFDPSIKDIIPPEGLELEMSYSLGFQDCFTVYGTVKFIFHINTSGVVDAGGDYCYDDEFKYYIGLGGSPTYTGSSPYDYEDDDIIYKWEYKKPSITGLKNEWEDLSSAYAGSINNDPNPIVFLIANPKNAGWKWGYVSKREFRVTVMRESNGCVLGKDVTVKSFENLDSKKILSTSDLGLLHVDLDYTVYGDAYYASYIKSDGDVFIKKDKERITLEAKNAVLLQKGLTIEKGGDFLAKLQDCRDPNIIDMALLGDGFRKGQIDFNEELSEIVEEDHEQELQNISLYPNPTEGNFTIKLPYETSSRIIVLDMLGKIILQEEGFDRLQINLEDYPSGMYMVRIQNEDHIETIKLMKE